MQFHSHEAIYLQIADYISEKILKKEWKDNDRIPAVRDIAVDVQVNPNTVVRTYAYLEENGIIYKQRGIGYFIAQDAYKKALALIKKDFLKHEVPAFLKKMELLGIDFDEIQGFVSKRGLPTDSQEAAGSSASSSRNFAAWRKYPGSSSLPNGPRIIGLAADFRGDGSEMDTANPQNNDEIDFEQSTSPNFSVSKKQAISAENKLISLPLVEKVTVMEDKTETIIEPSPDISSDKSMSWD